MDYTDTGKRPAAAEQNRMVKKSETTTTVGRRRTSWRYGMPGYHYENHYESDYRYRSGVLRQSTHKRHCEPYEHSPQSVVAEPTSMRMDVQK